MKLTDAEQQKPDIKKYILYDSNYTRFWNRQHCSKNKSEALPGAWRLTRKGHLGTFQNKKKALCIDGSMVTWELKG